MHCLAHRVQARPGVGGADVSSAGSAGRAGVAAGLPQAGDRLPKVREVVAELAINPNTVLKAYRELENKGLTSGRPGQGTFIDGSLGQATLPQLAGLRRSLRGWLAEADAAGLDEDGIVALVTSTMRDFSERRGTAGSRRSPRAAAPAGGVA